MKKRDLFAVHEQLSEELRPLRFAPPVAFVYDPLMYASRPLRVYLDRYGRGEREILLLGMNPGPFGMAQTGVPFGDPEMVRGWLGIRERVGKPPKEHPKRPIRGFECPRREVSGQRLWGWARERFGVPERFFERFIVLNYCPLVFMEESGRNRTPNKLPGREREPLFRACDAALRAFVEILRPRLVLGIGAFAESRAKAALEEMGTGVGRIPHPSPASPLANGGWAEATERELDAMGVRLPGRRT